MRLVDPVGGCQRGDRQEAEDELRELRPHEGRLGAQNGYLNFELMSGQIGSLPIPQSTLESAVRRIMESPENREKLKLPPQIADLRIENGEVVASYR